MSNDVEKEELEAAKAAAGDKLDQTIVTSKKIVIDEKTGRVSFAESAATTSPEQEAVVNTAKEAERAKELEASEEVLREESSDASSGAPQEVEATDSSGEEELAETSCDTRVEYVVELDEGQVEQDPAAQSTEQSEDETTKGESAEDGTTQESLEKLVEPSEEPAPDPVGADTEVGENELAPAEQTSPDDGSAAPPIAGDNATKSNKRLSAQTLFEFALPQTVLQGKADVGLDDLDDPTAKRTALSPSRKLSGAVGGNVKWIMGIAALVVVLVGFLFVSSGSDDSPGATDPVTTTPPSDNSEQIVSGTQVGGETLVVTETQASDPETVNSEIGADPDVVPPVTVGESEPLDINTVDLSIPLDQMNDDQLIAALAVDDVSALDRAVREAASRKSDRLNARILDFSDHPNMLIRVSVAKAFARKSAYSVDQRTAVVSKLLTMLDDKEYLVRGFSAKALGAAGDVSAKPKLQARLAAENNDVVRQIVRAAIDELESK